MEQFAIIYISFDGGHSYRATRVTEQTFKRKMWSTICAWLRPDGEMAIAGYCVDIIVRKKDLSHIGTLRVNGYDDIKDYWRPICGLWKDIAAVACEIE